MQGLPPESALHRDGKMWTQANELAALVVEKVEARLYGLTAMQAKHPGDVEKPISIVHPQRPKPEPKPRNRAKTVAEVTRALTRGK